MNWNQSYNAQWRIFRVNRDTWADAEQITNVATASVSRTADGSLLESGSFEVTGEFDADYYRIVMTAEQGGNVERVDVATLLFSVKGGKVDYGTSFQNADGYSVLHPASKTAVMTGEYAPAGVDGAEYAAKLLRSAINAPVEVEGSFKLNDNVVHEIGSPILSAAWAVLTAGNFVIQIDGRGVVHIRPRPTEPALIIDSESMKLLQNGIQYSADESDVPNRYIVIVGNNKTIAVNDDPNSTVSTTVRGYFVDEVDESPTPVNGETLPAYASRRLHELSVVFDERTYTREYAPDVWPYSIVRASIDGLEGDRRVTSQTLTCNYGVTLQEKSTREIKLW